MKFGDLVKKYRLEKRLSLRLFCKQNDLDPSNWSKMERGIIPPPQNHEILRKYADFLEIVHGSDDWYYFIDTANADAGIIPKDILSDDELVKALPMFFRTLRNKKPTKEELLDFADHLRKNP